MSDDEDGCEWVSVSSGTGLPGLSRTKAVKWLCVCSTQYSFQLRALWCILIKITVFDVSVLFI